jgi:hypothetical protein
MDPHQSRSEAVVVLPRINAHDKASALSAVHAGGQAHAAQHRALLADWAKLIPGIIQLHALVLKDLREAYCENRLHHTRQTKNRRASWLALYRPFTIRHGIRQSLRGRCLAKSRFMLHERKAA